MIPAPQTPFQSASLYVGDLKPEVTEARLFELFNQVGPVASIRICRDTVTRMSLGYGYVNFHNVTDADRAIDTMNFQNIDGKPCRIMWSQRDPGLRKSGVGNVFVKNLAPSVDNKDLYDLFSEFGNILSCKVATGEEGKSKGYGYVHFETAEAAEFAIAKLNGLVIEEHQVYVGMFVKRNERSGQADWTNLYVKQFPTAWDEEKLTSIFSAFGEIASVSLTKDEAGESKRFGFVNFTEHEPAEKAVEELNGKKFEEEGEEPFELYVTRFQKKNERSRDIKQKLDTIRGERITKYQGMNLYVKNLDDTVTDEQFNEIFSAFGTITSSRIMRDENKASKGFGFICYSSPEEATRCVSELNGTVINGKPIVVTLHQRKDLRRAHLAAQFGPRQRFPINQGPVPYMPMYMNPNQPMGRQQPGFMPMPGMMPRPPRGAIPGNYRGQQGYPMPSYGGGMPNMQQGANGFKRVPGQPPQQPGARRMGPGRGGPGGRGMQGPGGRGPNNNMKFTGQVRNQPQMGMMPPQQMPPQMMQQTPSMPQQGMVPGIGEPLDHNILAQADSQTQKNMIGERLYPLIHRSQPELAGKITGMLLEMDNAELLHLLESPEALLGKIEEALQVLKAHTGDE